MSNFSEMMEHYLTPEDFEQYAHKDDVYIVNHPANQPVDLADEKIAERAKTSRARKINYFVKLRKMKQAQYQRKHDTNEWLKNEHDERAEESIRQQIYEYNNPVMDE